MAQVPPQIPPLPPAVPVPQPATVTFNAVLGNTLRLTARQIINLNDDGYTIASDLNYWKFCDIEKWCEAKTKLTQARGGTNWGARSVQRLQGFAWWITHMTLRGLPLILAAFDGVTLDDSIEQSKLDNDAEDADIDKPSKFKMSEWDQFEDDLYLYLTTLRNARTAPLVYVNRKDIDPTEILSTDDEIIYHAPLQGNTFNRDTKRVIQIIRELTNGTDAEEWIKGLKCGRQAMQALQLHYDGDAAGKSKIQAAKDGLEKIHYRNESTFSFEKYVTRLKKNFNVLEKKSKELDEDDKVEYLLENCRCNDREFQNEVTVCRATKATTFDEAATYMQTQINRLFPQTELRSRYTRKIRSAQRGRGRDRGRGGRGRGRDNLRMV